MSGLGLKRGYEDCLCMHMAKLRLSLCFYFAPLLSTGSLPRPPVSCITDDSASSVLDLCSVLTIRFPRHGFFGIKVFGEAIMTPRRCK